MVSFSPKEVVSIGVFLSHFCSFLYIGVYCNVLKLYIRDVIVSQKGSNVLTRSKHTPVYEKDTKQIHNKSMETTKGETMQKVVNPINLPD